MKRNPNGSYSPNTPIDMNNPEVYEEKDWWNEMCEAHGAKNFWKKKKKTAKKNEQST
jgi:hypothetical protein